MKNSFSLKDLEKITNGNAAALKELLEVFVRETSLQIGLLEAFLSNGDLETVRNTAHKIKSSLTLLGLDKFRPLAENIEKFSEGDNKTITEDVRSLITLYKQVHEELKANLNELS